MFTEIPGFGLKAYALFFSKHSTKGKFTQSELDWIVSQSMKKKIFAMLLNAGWIEKASRTEYRCINPDKVIRGLLEFKVLNIIKESKKPYALTNLSAVEIWSDYSYVQRGVEKSPYFIKVLSRDLKYWKDFFNKSNISNYVNEGTTIGEFIILKPSKKLKFEEKDGLKVENLKDTMRIAKDNEMYKYAYEYMRKKYGYASS